MRLFTTLKYAAGVGLCAVACTGSALADPGNGNGNGNGNGGTPPGQERKAEQQATPAVPATPATQAPAPEQAKPDKAGKSKPKSEHKREKPDHMADHKAERKSEQKAKAKVHSKAKAHSKAKVHSKAKTETKASGSKGRSAEAHHHVIICHRTGSASNPYVVINIPWTAWSEAHSPDTGAHPDLDGRHDIMLKNPASRPGSKDGFTKSSCGSPAAPAVAPQQSRPVDVCPNVEGMQSTVPAGYVKDTSGNCVLLAQQTDVCPNIEGMQTTVPAGLVKDASGTCALLTTAAVVQTKVENKVEKKDASQVLAATSPATPAKAKAAATPATGEQPAGGVLGAVASPAESIAQTATSGTLPFTGIPLWIAVLLGAGLLATGVALRRAAQH